MEYAYSPVANWLYMLACPLTHLACEYTLCFLKKQSNRNNRYAPQPFYYKDILTTGGPLGLNFKEGIVSLNMSLQIILPRHVDGCRLVKKVVTILPFIISTSSILFSLEHLEIKHTASHSFST
jgi:hypothetical protein